jgi:hypothetical protein
LNPGTEHVHPAGDVERFRRICLKVRLHLRDFVGLKRLVAVSAGGASWAGSAPAAAAMRSAATFVSTMALGFSTEVDPA